MPELIRRGFDKIVWDQKIHNMIKSKWFRKHENDLNDNQTDLE